MMTDGVFLGILVALVVVSGFFSGAETAMMRINRYRLRHKALTGDQGARRVLHLLSRPDRLLGVVLIGNTLANIMASSVVTVLAAKWLGDAGIALAAFVLTLVVLIFAEVMPKTVAALYSERVAYPVAWVLSGLLRVVYPLVWCINGVSNALLWCCGVSTQQKAVEALSREELRTIVRDAMGDGAPERQQMLLRVLDLEQATVNDLMVPRNAIVGIDLDADWQNILAVLDACTHAWLPVYRGSFDQVQGILTLQKAYKAMLAGQLDKEKLMTLVEEAYFVPELTPLSAQLLEFKKRKQSIAIVVDEYGDVLGLVTLEDLLEEIVGEYAHDSVVADPMVEALDDGSFLLAGDAFVRELNRTQGWALPTRGPKTLNGQVLERLECIPQTGQRLQVGPYDAEIVSVKGQRVSRLRLWPQSAADKNT